MPVTENRPFYLVLQLPFLFILKLVVHWLHCLIHHHCTITILLFFGFSKYLISDSLSLAPQIGLFFFVVSLELCQVEYKLIFFPLFLHFFFISNVFFELASVAPSLYMNCASNVT